ncbi:MAG: sigma-70 family RNA polymerase sigma factor [Deltaproteobacteria bacterium]|nr:sigma-70 family RNA polymerase sigma factor [Deltaproteobacteria bacterium]
MSSRENTSKKASKKPSWAPRKRSTSPGSGKSLSSTKRKLLLKKIADGKLAKATKGRLTRKQSDKLITEHMESSVRIAWSMLNRWRSRIPHDEVQSIVGMALCEAAARFDKTMGVSFRTFSFYHLRGLLLREISRRIGEYRFAGTVDDAELSVNVDHFGSDPAGWPFALVDHATPEHHVAEDQVSKVMWAACAHLDELEREVILRCFVNDQNVADIAKELGYCRCHVSRVKSRALKLLEKQLGPVLGHEAAESEESQGAKIIHLRTYRGGRGRRRSQTPTKLTVANG